MTSTVECVKSKSNRIKVILQQVKIQSVCERHMKTLLSASNEKYHTNKRIYSQICEQRPPCAKTKQWSIEPGGLCS